MTKNDSLADVTRKFYSKGLEAVREIADYVLPRPNDFNFAVAGGYERTGGESYERRNEDSPFAGLDSQACFMSRVRDRNGNHRDGCQSRTFRQAGKKGKLITVKTEDYENAEEINAYLMERGIPATMRKRIQKYVRRLNGDDATIKIISQRGR